MNAPFQDIASLDKLVHEPARLAIMTALSACREADFLFLQGLTGLSKGNLSSHLGKLEAAGLVVIEKRFEGKLPQTRVALTDPGRAALERHWERLEEARRAAGRWHPNRSSPET